MKGVTMVASRNKNKGRAYVVLLLLPLFLILFSRFAAAMSFEERVKRQEAIDRLYDQSTATESGTQQWDAARGRRIAEKKVTLYLHQTVALEKHWNRTINGEILQAEIARIMKNTKDPALLGKIFAELNNDPYLIAECVARPALVDRLARGSFAYDRLLHSASRQSAQRALALFQRNQDPAGANMITFKRDDLPEGMFERAEKIYSAPGNSLRIEETRDSFVVRKTLSQTKDRIAAEIVLVPKLEFDVWLTEQNFPTEVAEPSFAYSISSASAGAGAGADKPTAPESWASLFYYPSPVWDHVSVWTGTHVIIFGGQTLNGPTNHGSVYDPILDVWSQTRVLNAPSPRWNASATWTGSVMVVFGGAVASPEALAGDGARYDPDSDRWDPINTENAPPPRESAASAYIGNNKTLIWGGYGYAPYSDGAIYDATLDTWAPMNSADAPSARWRFASAWTGSRFIVYGGCAAFNPIQQRCTDIADGGALYRPSDDSWTTLPAAGAPSERWLSAGAWTGGEFVVWGGVDIAGTTLNDGARYNYFNNIWQPMAASPLQPRAEVQAQWAGDRLLLWGGYNSSVTDDNGAEYIPSIDSWQLMAGPGPKTKYSFTSHWTGTELFLIGGLEIQSGNPGLCYVEKYNPDLRQWTATCPPAGLPEARFDHVAAFGGGRMLIFGGFSFNYLPLNSAGLYDPTLDQWTPVPSIGAPSPRQDPTAFYANGAFYVWGGINPLNACQGYADGAFYIPGAESWTPMNPAPIDYSTQAVVFTGTYLAAFGGRDCTDHNDLHWYDPASDLWNSTVLDLLLPRHGAAIGGHQGRIFLYGGYVGESPDTPNGGIYDIESGVFNVIADPTFPCSLRGSGRAFYSTATGRNYWLAETNGSSGEPALQIMDDTTFECGTIIESPYSFYHTLFDGYYHHNMLFDSTDGSILSSRFTEFFPSFWSARPPQPFLTPRIGYSLVLGNKGVILWDGGTQDQSGAIYYPNTPARAIVNDPPDHVLGSGLDVIFDASLSTSGSNPEFGYEDPFDHIYLYQWGINAKCADNASEYSTSAPFLDLTESQLLLEGIDHPGVYPYSVVVRDLEEGSSCIHGQLHVLDSIAPTVKLTSPNGGESWPYSASETDSTFRLIAWDSADNYGIAQTRVTYSCDAGNTWSCIADSELQADCLLIESSDESLVWKMPTIEEAQAAGQIFPSATCSILVEVWDDSSLYQYDSSDGNFYIIEPNTESVQTAILWNSQRIEAIYGTQAAGDMSSKLQELAAHDRVSGMVFDLATSPLIQTAYADWDANPTNQDLAHTTAAAIKAYLASQLQTFTSVQFLILVGDDLQIPFYRMLDGTSIYPESNYPGEVPFDVSTTVGSAIAQGYFLTDNYYSEFSPEPSGLPAPNDLVYLDDLYTGRLVETPEQIEGVINAFLEQNGQVNVASPSDRILVSGHDFLYDSAFAIKELYSAAKPTDCLLDDPNSSAASPCFDLPYSPSDFQAQLLSNPAHRIASINTHANHFTFQTSSGPLDTTTLDSDPQTMKPSVVYSSGCHSGLPVPATSGQTLDWTELMAKKQVIGYIGNTGYGWGLLYGIGLTERLMKNLTEAILNNPPLISVGKVLSDAKRAYHLADPRYDVFDMKVQHQLTLFGIPNYQIVTSDTGSRQHTSDELPSAGDGPSGCASGICLHQGLSAAATVPPGVTELNLSFVFGAQTYRMVNTPDGHYFQLNGLASGEAGQVIQPQFVYNSKLSGTVAHSIIFIGGNYSVIHEASPGVNFDPVVAVPRSTNTNNGEGPLPVKRIITPRIQSSSAAGGGSTVRLASRMTAADDSSFTNLVVETAYYDTQTQIERRFDSMQFAAYYSNSDDTNGPVFADPGSGGFHLVSGNSAVITANVDDPDGVFRVLLTFNDTFVGKWQSQDLTFNSGSGKWETTISFTGETYYFLQAIDNNGNVGALLDSGTDLDGNGDPYGSSWSAPRIFTIGAGPSSIYYDDFEDGIITDWNAGSHWSVIAGELVGTTAKTADAASPEFVSCSICTFETEVSLDSAGDRASLIAWNASSARRVEVILMPDKGKIRLRQKFGGSVIASQSASFTFTPDLRYRLAVSYAGGSISLSIDGTKVINLSTSKAPAGGMMKLRVKSADEKQAAARFEYVRVY